MKELRVEKIVHFPFDAVSAVLVSSAFKRSFHESQSHINIEVGEWSVNLGKAPDTKGQIAVRDAKYAAPVKGPKIIKKFIGKDHTRCEEQQRLQVDQEDGSALLRISTTMFDIPMADKYSLSLAYTLSRAAPYQTRVVVVVEAEFKKKMMKAMIEKQLISATQESLDAWFPQLEQQSEQTRDEILKYHRHLTPAQRLSDTAILGIHQAQEENQREADAHVADSGETGPGPVTRSTSREGGLDAPPAPMHGRSKTPPRQRRNTAVSALVSPELVASAEHGAFLSPTKPAPTPSRKPPAPPPATPNEGGDTTADSPVRPTPRRAPPGPPPAIRKSSVDAGKAQTLEEPAAPTERAVSPVPRRAPPRPPPSAREETDGASSTDAGATTRTATPSPPESPKEQRTVAPVIVNRISAAEGDVPKEVPVPASPARPPPRRSSASRPPPTSSKEPEAPANRDALPPRTRRSTAGSTATPDGRSAAVPGRVSESQAPRSDPMHRRTSVSSRPLRKLSRDVSTTSEPHFNVRLGRTHVSRSLTQDLLDVPGAAQGRRRGSSVAAREGYIQAGPARSVEPVKPSVYDKVNVMLAKSSGGEQRSGSNSGQGAIKLSLSASRFECADSSKAAGGAFTIHIASNYHSWEVVRTYRELEVLHRSLAGSVNPETLPFFPPKALFTTHDRSDYGPGRHALVHAYLTQLLCHHDRVPARAALLEGGYLDRFFELDRVLKHVAAR